MTPTCSRAGSSRASPGRGELGQEPVHLTVEEGIEGGVEPPVGGRLLLRIGGVFSPPLRTLQDTLYQFEAPYVVDGSAYRDRFVDPGTPIDEVVATTVECYRSRARS